MVRRSGSRNGVQCRLRRDPRCWRSHLARWGRCAWVSRLARHPLDWWRVNDDSAGTGASATPSGRAGPRKGEGSARRRRQRPPGGTPRSRAPSASCLPLSRLVRHRVISPSAAARGLGTFDPISAREALQSLVRVVRPGCRYLDGGGVHPLLVTRSPPLSARGEAGFSVKVKRTMGLEPTTLGLGSQCSTN